MGPIFKETPTMFSMFHIITMIVSLLICVFFFIFAKKHNDKKDSLVVLGFSLFLFVTEIWKQTVRTIANGGQYPFGIFPFQLCSIPMYLGIIAFFIKNKKVKESIYTYITLTGIIGGVAMLTVPMVIFSNYILFTLHSIAWHIVLVAQGVYLARARNIGRNILKDVIPTIPVIAVIVTIAVILNATPYGFNLLSLSTKFVNDPPLLNQIYQKVSYPIYVVIVFSGLVAGVTLVDLVIFLIRKIKGALVKNEN